MKIETKFFGTTEVNEHEFINFGHGIPGFENFHRYIILKFNESSPFLIMQSVENQGLAFILILLEEVIPGYSIDLPDETAAELKLEQPGDAAVYAITVLPDDISKATVNLAAPIVVNTKGKNGKQIILNNPAYGLKHPLFTPVQEEPCAKTATK